MEINYLEKLSPIFYEFQNSIDKVKSDVKREETSNPHRLTAAGQRRLKTETPSNLSRQGLLEERRQFGGEEVIYYIDTKTNSSFVFNERTSTLSYAGGGLKPDINILIELLISLKVKNAKLQAYFHTHADQQYVKELREKFYCFVNAIPDTSLSSLSLEFCNLGSGSYVISDDEIKYLAQTLFKTGINELDLRGSYLNCEAVKSLAESLPKSKISKLKIAIPYLDIFGEQIIKYAELEELDLSVMEKNIESLSKTLSDSKIKKLSLSGFAINNHNLLVLAKGISFSNLEEVTLACYGGISIGQRDSLNELIEVLVQSKHLKKINIGAVYDYSAEIRRNITDLLKKHNIEIYMWEKDVGW